MPSNITYEWIVEDIDENEEIIDINHFDKFPGFPTANTNVALVRDDCYFKQPRAWAYIKDNTFPEYFLDAHGIKIARVPIKFHREVIDFYLKK